MKRILSVILSALLVISVFSVTAMAMPTDGASRAASTDLYVSDDGSDSAAGTSSAPLKSFEKALSTVPANGTIHIVGTVTLPSGFSWATSNKAVTVTGGTLNAQSVASGRLIVGNDVTFQNMTLSMAASGSLFANGHRVEIGSSVSVPTSITLYGGGIENSTVEATDLTVLSGVYTKIYGGSLKGTVNGDTNLYVGGNVNSSIDETNHGGGNNIFGGGSNDTVKGDTHLTLAESAKAHYIYGGSDGSSAKISGTATMLVIGGKAMSIYGGSKSGDKTHNVSLTITGGTFEQVFGGSDGGSLTGNVNVYVLGGTITRRVYGGCYNEVKQSGLSVSWSSKYYVVGTIALVIGGAPVTFTASDDDRSIYAHSRQKTLSSSEETQIIFADKTAYDTYKNKLGASDLVMKIIMSGVSAADQTHYYTYTADAATGTITEKCSYHSALSATATIAKDDSVSLAYTGKEIKAAKVTYSSDWEWEPLTVAYESNVNVGTATATATVGGVSVTLSYAITKATQKAPSIGKVDEEIAGKGNGKLTGLSTAMEYSTDGTAYTAVTNVNALFAPGTYYVRYREDDNHIASDPTTVKIAEGRLLKITFKAEGSADIVREVRYNGTLTDIPSIPARQGYTETPPAWSVTNFVGIVSDMTVNAIYTKDPVKTTKPVETTNPAETTKPAETTARPSTTSLAETTVSPETTIPVTTTESVNTTTSENKTDNTTALQEPAVTTDPMLPTDSEIAPELTDPEVDSDLSPETTESSPESAPEASITEQSPSAPSTGSGCSGIIGGAATAMMILSSVIGVLAVRKKEEE